MHHLKHKHLSFVISFAIAISALLSLVSFPVAHADPLPSCDYSSGARLVMPTNGDAPYCSCPTGKVVNVVGTTNTCVSQCPSGTVATIIHGQTYCNAPIKCSDGSNAPNNDPSQCGTGAYNFSAPTTASHQCGGGDHAVRTAIDFGCKGAQASCPKNTNPTGYCSPVIDIAFAIIRFLSAGVGLVIIASIIVAGIQYTTSRGDPKATAAAETRIKSTVIALLIFIFAYAILNYVIPKGFFGA